MSWRALLVVLPMVWPAELVGQSAGGPGTRPATRPAARAPAPAPANPIADAVKALLAEFAEAQQANRTYTRQRPDFFDNAAERPTAEQVWRALEARHAPDPRADAYVKWQLLSALPPGPTDDPAEMRRIAGLLGRAPAPALHPLLEPRHRTQLESMAARLRPGSEDEANDRLRELSENAMKYNLPVFYYREALTDRIPPSAGRFVLAFEDLAERAKLGWSADRYRQKLLTDIRNWASSPGTSARDIETVVQAIARLRGVQSEEMPSRLRPDGMGLRWDRRRARVESWDNTVLSLQNELTQRLRSAGGR